MSYSILRVAKVKGSVNTRGLQRHNQRENENYNNKDINHEETYRNYDLINEQSIDYQKIIDEAIDANYSGKRAIRKDAIRHVDGLITSDKEFFEKLSDRETKQFFQESLEFLKDEYGTENMLYATVHMDEKVPHMHFGFVPLTEDGRLPAKERLGNKKALTELQDRFNLYVNEKGYKLERGTSTQVTEKEHKDMDRYKKETEYHKQELETVKTDLKDLKEELNVDIERLNHASEFEYEDERKGLFSGREETGRKILSADEFERLQVTISSAERIVEDYERIRNTDYYKENQELKENKKSFKEIINTWREGYHEKSNKVRELEEENADLKSKLDLSQEFQNGTVALYYVARQQFPGFEKGFNKLKERFLKDSKFERIGQHMELLQDNVYQVDKKKDKQRKNDLEL